MVMTMMMMMISTIILSHKLIHTISDEDWKNGTIHEGFRNSRLTCGLCEYQLQPCFQPLLPSNKFIHRNPHPFLHPPFSMFIRKMAVYNEILPILSYMLIENFEIPRSYVTISTIVVQTMHFN